METDDLAVIYNKYRIIIFPALVVMVGILLIVLVIYPQSIKLLNNNKAYGGLVDQNKFLDVKAQELQSYDIQDLQKKVNISLTALPSDQDYAEVINILENLVDTAGFNLVSLSFGSGKQTENGRSLFSVRLEAIGPKSALNSLLTNIESSYRPMKVSSFDINSSGSGDTLNAIISIDIFFQPLPSSLGGVNSPVPKFTDKDEQLLNILARSTSAGLNTLILPARGKLNPFQ